MLGENLAYMWSVRGAYPSAASTIQGWIDEEADWTYPGQCKPGKMCGHWTQVIWADTTHVGCEVYRSCRSLAGITSIPASAKLTYVVCSYAPGGNIVGELEYEPPHTVPVGDASSVSLSTIVVALALISAFL